MNMADVSAVFGSLLALGIAFPGMLVAWWLLFPATVERSRLRLDQTPWRCLALGGGLAVPTLFFILFLLSRPAGPVKFLGLALLVVTLLLASLGAAGLAAKMGERLRASSVDGLSPLASFVRGAIALELAAIFPFLGWFLVLPLLLVSALGASAFALLRWEPSLPRGATEELRTGRGVSDVATSP